MIDWLFGIPARQVSGNIYEIHITGYGMAEVGPYVDLRKYVGVGTTLECHHIVEKEHLKMVATRFTENNAPAVAILADFHRKLMSPRFTAEQGVLGGRRGGKVSVSKSELLELYKQVYTWHTQCRELYAIAQKVLR